MVSVPEPPERLVCLAGADVTELGRIATAALDERTALALSRGRFAKGYDAVDPNEDAVLAACGHAGRLLAVLDGHEGTEASHAALASLAADAPVTLRDRGQDFQPGAALTALVEHARTAIAEATSEAAPPRDRSRTALVLVHLVPNEGGSGAVATWCAYGDGVLVHLHGRRARVLAVPNQFLGPSSPQPHTSVTSMDAGDRLVLASDGLSDHLGRRWTRRLAGTVRGVTPEAAARGLVEEAHRGGAGDNVAVLVADIGARDVPASTSRGRREAHSKPDLRVRG